MFYDYFFEKSDFISKFLVIQLFFTKFVNTKSFKLIKFYLRPISAYTF